MAASHLYSGQCHCGAIRAALTFTTMPEATQVRSCQCGFCTRQGAMTISDPAGSALFDIAGGALNAYEFASRTATSLICARCGVYAGAVLKDGAHTWSIANVRGLAIPEFSGRTGQPMVYDTETPEQRIARRKQRWTPTELRTRT